MIAGFKTNSPAEILTQVKVNRDLLVKLASFSGLNIETPLLKTLIETASDLGGAAKTSGAGGGDCGIALLTDTNQVSTLINRWQAAGIEPLAFNVYKE